MDNAWGSPWPDHLASNSDGCSYELQNRAFSSTISPFSTMASGSANQPHSLLTESFNDHDWFQSSTSKQIRDAGFESADFNRIHESTSRQPAADNEHDARESRNVNQDDSNLQYAKDIVKPIVNNIANIAIISNDDLKKSTASSSSLDELVNWTIPDHLNHLPVDTELTIDVYEVFLLHDAVDTHLTELFKEDINMKCGRKVSVLCFEDPQCQWVTYQIDRLEFGMKKAAYTFLFVTEKFKRDDFSHFCTNTLLSVTINDTSKRYTVIPVFVNTCRNDIFALQALAGIHFWSYKNSEAELHRQLYENRIKSILSPENPKFQNILKIKRRDLNDRREDWVSENEEMEIEKNRWKEERKQERINRRKADMRLEYNQEQERLKTLQEEQRLEDMRRAFESEITIPKTQSSLPSDFLSSSSSENTTSSDYELPSNNVININDAACEMRPPVSDVSQIVRNSQAQALSAHKTKTNDGGANIIVNMTISGSSIVMGDQLAIHKAIDDSQSLTKERRGDQIAVKVPQETLLQDGTYKDISLNLPDVNDDLAEFDDDL